MMHWLWMFEQQTTAEQVHSESERTPPAPLPRAEGRVRLSLRRRDQRTVIERLHQAGSSKAMLPRTPGNDLTAVLLNTAGGITGGDRFRAEIHAGAETTLALTSQTAERIYRAVPGQTGRVRTSLHAEDGAMLAWLPQETILFDRSALDRRLEVHLSASARFVGVEALVFGRYAMGETVRRVHLADHWRVYRDGRLAYADALRLSGDVNDVLPRAAVLAGNRVLATVLLAGGDAEAHLNRLRALLPEASGASLIRPGILVARLVAPTAQALRRALIPVLECLNGPLPQVWKM